MPRRADPFKRLNILVEHEFCSIASRRAYPVIVHGSRLKKMPRAHYPRWRKLVGQSATRRHSRASWEDRPADTRMRGQFFNRLYRKAVGGAIFARRFFHQRSASCR